MQTVLVEEIAKKLVDLYIKEYYENGHVLFSTHAEAELGQPKRTPVYEPPLALQHALGGETRFKRHLVRVRLRLSKVR